MLGVTGVNTTMSKWSKVQCGIQYDSETIASNAEDASRKLRTARQSLTAILNELNGNNDPDLKAVIQICRQTLEEIK